MTDHEKRLINIEQSEVIIDALEKLEKADLVLNHWQNEYLFNDRPDPRAAIECLSTIGGTGDLKGRQSFIWYRDYDAITRFIRIASDYVYESKSTLENAMEKIQKGI